MKLTKTAIIAIIAAGGLLAAGPALRAQDAGKDAKKDAAPAETKAPKKGGKRALTIEQLTDRLKLTDEEKPKVQAALDDMAQKRRDLAPEDRATKGPAIYDEFSKKMKEILTADQYKEFEQMPRPGAKGKKGGGN